MPNNEQVKLAELERVIEDIGVACKRINEETLAHFKRPADKADFKMVIRSRLDAFTAELTERVQEAIAIGKATKAGEAFILSAYERRLYEAGVFTDCDRIERALAKGKEPSCRD